MHYDPFRARGERHGSAKLTGEDVIDIRELAAQGLTRRELARWYGVHNGTITRIVNRKSWVHIAPRLAERKARADRVTSIAFQIHHAMKVS